MSLLAVSRTCPLWGEIITNDPKLMNKLQLARKNERTIVNIFYSRPMKFYTFANNEAVEYLNRFFKHCHSTNLY